MKCPKCGGLMTNFKHYGFGSDLAGHFYGWHCMCCGEILDPVIVANRARSTNVAVGPKEWGPRSKRPSTGSCLPNPDPERGFSFSPDIQQTSAGIPVRAAPKNLSQGFRPESEGSFEGAGAPSDPSWTS